MMNKVITFVFVLLCSIGFTRAVTAACPTAVSSNLPGFCNSFKSVAECHCTSSGLPKGMCQNMKLLFTRMISTFGSVQRACEFQHDTSVQTCIEAWNCYRLGGQNSNNQLCSGTGLPCE